MASRRAFRSISVAALSAVLLGACSSTTITQGPPGGDGGGGSSSSGSSGTSGASSSGGTSGTADGGGKCQNIAGTWKISGLCGDDVCLITQTACATSFACGGGSVSYTGTVVDNAVTYSGKNAAGDQGTCSGVLSGTRITGSCTLDSGAACAFTATKN